MKRETGQSKKGIFKGQMEIITIDVNGEFIEG